MEDEIKTIFGGDGIASIVDKYEIIPVYNKLNNLINELEDEESIYYEIAKEDVNVFLKTKISNMIDKCRSKSILDAAEDISNCNSNIGVDDIECIIVDIIDNIKSIDEKIRKNDSGSLCVEVLKELRQTRIALAASIIMS